MPVVPTAQSAGLGQVESARMGQLPEVRQSINTSPAVFGGAQAEQMQDLGRSGMRAGVQAFRVEEQNAALEAADLELQAQRDMQTFLYEGDAALLNTKGAQALGSSEAFKTKMSELRQSYLNRTKNPMVQQILGRSFDKLEVGTMDGVYRHENAERRGYASELAGAKAAMADETIGLNWNNDEKFNEELEQKRAAVFAQARLDGTSQEGINLALRNAESGSYRVRLATMLETDDPMTIAQAGDLYEKARADGKFNLKDMMDLEKTFDAVLPKARAIAAFSKTQEQNALASMESGDLFDRLLKQESGGRQFNADGTVVTSQVGATGIAQIMPETGPEAARMAGLAWDPEKFKNDSEYNRTLGKAYFNNMREKYGSNALALAAYNAGPGMVDDWINGTNKTGKNASGLKLGDPRKGETTLGEFISRIPFKETREYVPAILGQVQEQRNYGLDPAVTAAHRANMPEAERPYYDSLVEQYNTAQANKVKQGKNDALASVQEVLELSNGNLNAIPPNVRTAAIKAGVWDQVTQYRGQTDPYFQANLKAMTTDELMAVDFTDPETRMHLSATEFNTWQKKQADLVKDPKNEALSKRVDDALSYVYGRDYKKEYASFKSSTSNDAKADKARAGRIREQLTAEIENTYRETGKVPTADEVMKIADKMMLNREIDPPGLMNKVADVFDVTIDQVPEKLLPGIEDGLRKAGLDITPANVLRAYRLHLYQWADNG